jgi:hypothetical protein
MYWLIRKRARSGHGQKVQRRRCGCQTQSVLADEVEDDFCRLVNTLQVHQQAVQLMAELAIQSQFGGLSSEDEVKLDEQKAVAIGKHRRALKNNLMLFQNGEIEAEDYYPQKDHHERQIAY